jgi:hypothetical protein
MRNDTPLAWKTSPRGPAPLSRAAKHRECGWESHRYANPTVEVEEIPGVDEIHRTLYYSLSRIEE